MADKNIGSLPAASALDDDSLLVAEQQGKAVHFRGKLLKDYARQGVDALVTAAQEAATKAAQAAKEAQEAADAVADVSADTEAAKAAAVAAENARAAAVQAAQNAEQAAALAAQNAASGVENRLAGYVSDAQSAKTGAETAKNAAEQAAETAAAEAVQQAESQLQEYVDDAEQAKEDAQGAAGAAAQEAVSAVGAEMAGYVSAAQAAQKAAEQARDEAQGIAGGDFASTAYVDNKASEAESNANKYTDQKIAAIPIPDVSEQIGTHNTNTDAHSDIRLLINELTNRLNALANSEDVDLDQMAELVAYIKDNRELIDQITTGKVSVSDIIDNLATNVANKPLSAAQGVALKALVDAAATAAANAQTTADSKQSKITGQAGQIVGFDTSGNPEAQEAPSGGGTIDENLVLITVEDIDEICNPAPVILPNTFQKVRAFTSGKEYILLFGYNGAYYCMSAEAFNDWTVKAAAVPEVTSTDAQITFATVPTLFTATASGDGFTLHNGANNIYGEATSHGTALKVNTDPGIVFTVDTSAMGGFDSDEIVPKVDEQAVWLRSAFEAGNTCLKFEAGNTSIGIDYKDRDATYSTGFLSFILYEKIS